MSNKHMELSKKSEWFRLASPIGEPDIKWYEDEYHIERVEYQNGQTVWFGQGTNWVKAAGGSAWTRLGDGGEFFPCPTPIYEILYESIKKATAENASIH